MDIYRLSEVEGGKNKVINIYFNHDIALDDMLKLEDSNNVDSGKYYIIETMEY